MAQSIVSVEPVSSGGSSVNDIFLDAAGAVADGSSSSSSSSSACSAAGGSSVSDLFQSATEAVVARSTGSSSFTADFSGPAPAILPYTEAECDAWLSGMIAKDGDGSSGLSEEEFHASVAGVAGSSFEELPWLFNVVHKSLACRCKDLGLGDGCCEGDLAEVSLLSLTKSDVHGR